MTGPDVHGRDPGQVPRSRSQRWWWGLAGASVTAYLFIALTRPNAAQPDLRAAWPWQGALPWSLSSAAVTAVLWTAIALGAAAVVVGLRGRVGALGWGVPIGVGALALVGAPIGSGDHLNYAAYGRILLQGGDPWVESPIDWGGGGDPIAGAVEAPWTTQPSVYGPVVTAIHAACAGLGGDRLRVVMLCWQVVVVASWLIVRVVLRRVLPASAHGRIDVVWTLNPLVVSAGVLGAHVDIVAAALVVVAIGAVARRPGAAGIVAAGAFAGLAAGVKVTYAVAVPALALTWALGWGAACSLWDGCARRTGWLILGFVPTIALIHAWTSPHVYDVLNRSRGSVALASPWRLVLRALADPLTDGVTRALIVAGAAVLAVALAVLFLRRIGIVGQVDASPRALSPGDGRAGATAALAVIAALSTAYSLSAPYSLPWYDLLAWAALPAVVAGPLDGVLLARMVIVSSAYVPGRVSGMTAGVEAVTLGWRREVAPWLQLGLWVATVIVFTVGRGGAPGGLGGWLASRPARGSRGSGVPPPQ